jgi:hypothetical protein
MCSRTALSPPWWVEHQNLYWHFITTGCNQRHQGFDWYILLFTNQRLCLSMLTMLPTPELHLVPARWSSRYVHHLRVPTSAHPVHRFYLGAEIPTCLDQFPDPVCAISDKPDSVLHRLAIPLFRSKWPEIYRERRPTISLWHESILGQFSFVFSSNSVLRWGVGKRRSFSALLSVQLKR